MNIKFERIPSRKVEVLILAFLSAIYSILLLSYSVLSFKEAIDWMLAAAAIAAHIVRYAILGRDGRILRKIYFVLPVVELFVLMAIFNSRSQTANAIFVVLVAEIIISYPKKFSLILSFAGYILYLVISGQTAGIIRQEEPLWTILLDAVGYSLLVIAVVIAKTQIIQSSVLKKLMLELKEKSAETEQMAVFMERDKIAGEMHDTVGHTLTTALVALEACRMLIPAGPESAGEKLKLARIQVKKALDELRSAVRRIKANEDITDFSSAVARLAEETERNAAIIIRADIRRVEGILSIQEKVLYGVVQEAITNAIKHGRCSEIELSLKEESGIIHLICTDNGIGTNKTDFGFGLSSMKERVEGLGGVMSVLSKTNYGFTVSVKMPLAR